MRRLRYAFEPKVGATVTLRDGAFHYVARVLRLQVGDRLQLFDGRQWQALARIDSIAAQSALLVLEQVEQQAAQATTLSLAVAIPKGERADWLVEKVTELGVHTLVWLTCARSVVRHAPGDNRHSRWLRLAEAAARQSGNSHVPHIVGPQPLAEHVAMQQADWRWVCATHGTRQDAGLLPPMSGHVTVLVGPEGGLTDEELQLTEEAGYTALALSRHILRVETAAVAATTLVMARAHAEEHE